ncbi:MAG: nucleic acid-binding protein [Spirochaetaceae bacterium]|nr:nucleic acid-binding protein [Spirochaetaceae bacterium]
METTNVFEQLKILQDILAEKYEIESKIEDAPKDLSLQDELLVRMKEEYIGINAAYEAAKARISQLKADLDEAVAARERGEKGMDTITTHREYEALDKEIKDASEKESQLRKELQSEERRFEDLSASMSLKEQQLEMGQKELDEKKTAWADNVATYRAELDALKLREDKIIPDLDPEMIFKFERIIRSKQNRGIVAVKGNVCDGCHMILPAQFANEVHRGEEIVFCPYCSRILFYEEPEEGETSFGLEDAGSLVDYDDDDYDDELDDDEDQDEVRELGEED